MAIIKAIQPYQLDEDYIGTIVSINTDGVVKKTRTGIDSVSDFGAAMRVDLSAGVLPALLTKKVALDKVLVETLWMLRGETNIKYLKDNNCGIWDQWVTPGTEVYEETEMTKSQMIEHLKKVKPSVIDPGMPNALERMTVEQLKTYGVEFPTKKKLVDGDLNEVYQAQWRKWEDTRLFDQHESEELTKLGYELVGKVEGTEKYVWTRCIDQLQRIIDTLKTNPDDRRMMVSAWNVGKLETMALPPCHLMFQFYSFELTSWQLAYLASMQDGLGIEELAGLTSSEISDFVESQTAEGSELDWWREKGAPMRGLSCMFYMRSNDVAIGKPFNWVAYPIIANVIAHMAGNHIVTDVIYVAGDVHVYMDQWEVKDSADNLVGGVAKHFQQWDDFAENMIIGDDGELSIHRPEGDPIELSLPKIKIKGEFTLDTIDLDNVEISGYKSLPFVKYPLAAK